ncbi:hypothetical protein BKA93DRAFT_817486 [Sparassis latifolia]|uniref:Uncharacterized protein n=1 Tax=Sparassis crispa TaxID=139825 RepID=A0A401GWI2_9APHY|nr:predicted protein [Sparassis crispa]GBE86542.1 predicted protein [Sparassis crispa]
MSSQTSRTLSSSTVAASSSLFDSLKLPRSEALARLRTNTIGIFILTVLTTLLPLPSLWTALSIVRSHAPVSTLYYTLCLLEVLAIFVFSTNILQASYALRYPRVSHPPPPPSPAKNINMSPLARPLKGLSASTSSSPQRQKSFTYATSPVSTPSRTINYTIPSSANAPFDTSFASSLPSPPASPASPLAAYRGKHASAVGRAFDGSLLSRLARVESDDDDD